MQPRKVVESEHDGFQQSTGASRRRLARVTARKVSRPFQLLSSRVPDRLVAEAAVRTKTFHESATPFQGLTNAPPPLSTNDFSAIPPRTDLKLGLTPGDEVIRRNLAGVRGDEATTSRPWLANPRGSYWAVAPSGKMIDVECSTRAGFHVDARLD